MNIAFWLQRTALRYPDRAAVFEGTSCVATYGTLFDRAVGLAAWLRARGVEPGARVALYLPNIPDYLTALFGIWHAGCVAVPINAKLHAKEVAWILSNARASLCLSQGLHLADVPLACEAVDMDTVDFAMAGDRAPVSRISTDTAWLFYTSGTTGRPKGVQITHRNIQSMSLCYQTDVDVVRPDHAALYAAPMSHGAGLYSMMHVLRGARHVFPMSRGFDPAEVLALAEAYGQIHMFAPPTMVKRLTDHAAAVGSAGSGLETIVYAGGPMYEVDILRAVDQFGPVFAQIYGQGECPMGITALTKSEVADRDCINWRDRLNSVGRAQTAVEVRITDNAGHVAAPGTIGEIEVRGDTVMAGYWDAPEATGNTIVDGWLRTGDMGCLDGQGYLTLMDRSKDVIISGGSNIYPREVEDVLLQHPSVSEASVIGHPHPEWGEEVVACLVLRKGQACSETELDSHCLNHIARFKRPKTYLFLDALPKNNYGKVLKTDLRTLALTRLSGGQPVPKSAP